MRHDEPMNRPPTLYARLLEGLRGQTGSKSQKQPNGEVWVVTQTGWNTVLEPDDMRVMGSICPPRPYRRGERIYRPGDPAESLFIVLEGNVKLSMPGAVGRERVVAVCGPDDFFGESFLTGTNTRHSEAVCLSDRTVVCPISRAQFMEVSHRVPSVAVAFAAVLAQRVQTLEAQLELMSSPAQARLGRCLLLLAARFGHEVEPGVIELSLGLNHEDWASLAATTRVSATQAMSAWRALGLVDGTRGEYRIQSLRLEAFIGQLELERV
jgi:CRP/FNR family transcriptional regulator, cyclic AMP receptor protein